MQIIGLEPANGYVKVKSGDIEECYPNRLRQLTGSEFDVFTTKKVVYSFENKQYVLEETGISSAGRNAERYATKQYLLESLIAITKVIKERDVSIIVGLPCVHYGDKEIHNSLISNLRGNHVINVNNDEFEINIKEVYIVCEPLGTLIDFVYNDRLTQVQDRADYNYLICDIGHGTTDIVSTKGLEVVQSTGFYIGGMDISRNLVRILNDKHRKDNTEFTIDDVTVGNKSTVRKHSKQISIKKELIEAKEYVVNELLSKINQHGFNLNDYDRVIFTGGGSLALESYLPTDDVKAIYYNAQVGNVRGFEKYGRILEVINNG